MGKNIVKIKQTKKATTKNKLKKYEQQKQNEQSEKQKKLIAKVNV